MPKDFSKLIVNQDIETLYGEYAQTHDSELGLILIDMAWELLNDKIVAFEPISCGEKREQFVLRVLYEKALYDFEYDHHANAQAIFEILSVACLDVDFLKAMQMHLLALIEAVDYKTFIDKWVASTQSETFYIGAFTQDALAQFKAGQTKLDTALEKNRKLFTKG